MIPARQRLFAVNFGLEGWALAWEIFKKQLKAASLKQLPLFRSTEMRMRSDFFCTAIPSSRFVHGLPVLVPE